VDRKTVLLCECRLNEVVPRDTVRQAKDALTQKGVDLIVVDDLCGLAARGDPSLQKHLKRGLSVLACHPRAVRHLVRRMVCASTEKEMSFYDLRGKDVARFWESLDVPQEIGSGDHSEERRIPWEEEWIPWFPVMDVDRCSGCGQCLNFCLFGVFQALEEGKIVVVHPDQCKTYCPACARVCPQSALIFPKHEEPAIYGVLPETATGEDADPEEALDLISKDVHEALARHRQKRSKRILDRERVARAIEERKACSCNRDLKEECT